MASRSKARYFISSRNWPRASCTSERIRRRRRVLSITRVRIRFDFLTAGLGQEIDRFGQIEHFAGNIVGCRFHNAYWLAHWCLLHGWLFFIGSTRRAETYQIAKKILNILSRNNLQKNTPLPCLRRSAEKTQRLIWKIFANPDTSTSYVDVHDQADMWRNGHTAH